MTRTWIIVLGVVVLIVAIPAYVILIPRIPRLWGETTPRPDRMQLEISDAERAILERVEEVRRRADVRILQRDLSRPENVKSNNEARIAAMKAYLAGGGAVLLELKWKTDEDEERAWYVAVTGRGRAFLVYDQSRSEFDTPIVRELPVEKVTLRLVSRVDPAETPKPYLYARGATPPENYRLWLFCLVSYRSPQGVVRQKEEKF